MKVTQKFKDKLDMVKFQLVRDTKSIFISTICFSSKIIPTDEVPTGATDGIKILINPEFFTKITDDEALFLMLHEAWHIALGHVTRLDTRDGELWNIACDLVINNMLKEQGYSIIEGSLLDSKFKGMSAEEVYHELEQDPDAKDKYPNPDDLQQGSGEDSPENSQGNSQSQPKPTQEEIDAHRKECVAKAMAAEEMANNEAGNIPNLLKDQLLDFLQPKLDWRTLLLKYMDSYAEEDYSMDKLNRRYITNGLYLPTMCSEGMGKLMVFDDESGSVSQEDLNKVATEVRAIKELTNPEELIIQPFSHELGKPVTYTREDYLHEIRQTISGGTEIAPVIERIEEEKPEVAIIFTDGYFHPVNFSGATDIIWVIVGNPGFTTDYGHVIHYE